MENLSATELGPLKTDIQAHLLTALKQGKTEQARVYQELERLRQFEPQSNTTCSHIPPHPKWALNTTEPPPPKSQDDVDALSCTICEETRKIEKERATFKNKVKAGNALAKAAECIRHWHDTNYNPDTKETEGMVVSASHVRSLWSATYAYRHTPSRIKIENTIGNVSKDILRGYLMGCGPAKIGDILKKFNIPDTGFASLSELAQEVGFDTKAWKKELDNEVEGLLKAFPEATHEQVAAYLDRTRTTIVAIANRAGLVCRNSKNRIIKTNEDKAIIAEYNRGKSISEVGMCLKLPYKKVTKTLKKFKLEVDKNRASFKRNRKPLAPDVELAVVRELIDPTIPYWKIAMKCGVQEKRVGKLAIKYKLGRKGLGLIEPRYDTKNDPEVELQDLRDKVQEWHPATASLAATA